MFTARWNLKEAEGKALARRTGLDRKTVRKYLQQGLKSPRYGPREPRPQLIGPYQDSLREPIEDYPQIRAPGFCGSCASSAMPAATRG